MPDDLTAALVTAAVTAALTWGTTYYGMKAKIRHDLVAQYDKDLRDRRLTAYAALWALTEPLARFSPARPLSGKGAHLLSRTLRRWYFRDGLLLSAKARKAYFALQNGLTGKDVAAASAGSEPLDPVVVEKLRKASTVLHTALCGDVGSRNPPMIGGPEQTGDEGQPSGQPVPEAAAKAGP
ncbi:MAG: hypothetical protein QOC65_1389 [Sphingomonadales bacterium]|nr:hypothetical protein [Sphingomonadales bacterium]